MRAVDIVLPKGHVKRGYCSLKVYESKFLYITQGQTNSYPFDNCPVLTIDFTTLRTRILSYDTEDAKRSYKDWEAYQFSALAYGLLMRHMSHKDFLSIIDASYKKGHEDGRIALRQDITKLLGME